MAIVLDQQVFGKFFEFPHTLQLVNRILKDGSRYLLFRFWPASLGYLHSEIPSFP